MPDPDDQDDLLLFADPPPARPVIGYDLTTVLRELAGAPLRPDERDVVSNFKRLRSRRKAVLYLNWLAERYGTARLAASEIPYR